MCSIKKWNFTTKHLWRQSPFCCCVPSTLCTSSDWVAVMSMSWMYVCMYRIYCLARNCMKTKWQYRDIDKFDLALLKKYLNGLIIAVWVVQLQRCRGVTFFIFILKMACGTSAQMKGIVSAMNFDRFMKLVRPTRFWLVSKKWILSGNLELEKDCWIIRIVMACVKRWHH